MRKVPCRMIDIELTQPGRYINGGFIPFSEIGYPIKKWWRFWEIKNTREEFFARKHERYSALEKCHMWEEQQFHFCAQ